MNDYTPAQAVVLEDPKIDWNVGNAIRNCASFGVPNLIWSGTRVMEPEFGGRLPREERMRGYKNVSLQRVDDLRTPWLPGYAAGRPRLAGLHERGIGYATIVAIEILPGTQPLTTYAHPENAVYVFGPEDGSVSQRVRSVCHEFVFIPSFHCLNLSNAIAVVLYDRLLKAQQAGTAPVLPVDQVFARSEA